jgi:aminopeptidase N
MKFVRHLLIAHFLFLISYSAFSQPFTHADTLRGSNGPARDWWNVLHYDITVKPDFINKTIEGKTTIEFNALKNDEKIMQIDLQDPMVIDSAILYVFFINDSLNIKRLFMTTLIPKNVVPIVFKKEDNSYKLNLPWKCYTTHSYSITIYYHGQPREAVRPPWDGGWIWKNDKNGNPWMSVACQGLGASVWYPCKDYQGDEPDNGASLTITVPDTLMAVANGRLINSTDNKDGTKSYKWEVKAPINNYCIIPYIGKYVHFGEIYRGEKGNLTMDYWVLDYNLDKAKKQFKDATRMMKAFEYWFGPYPFYEDGYKLVEAPYIGMENQSDIAYGNGYQNGYDGHDPSFTGLGMKWDFIIIHESGHEWFANNITAKDIADMWIHEGFTTYSETLFTEYYYGKQAADDFVIGQRKNIENKNVIITPYGVNDEPADNDMYYKAANMIHTIRQVINNDSLFRQILTGLNKTFYHQTVTTKQIEDYISTKSKIDFSKVFDQYLRTIQIPTLEYKIDGNKFLYHWTNGVPGFNLPLKINFNGEHWINPTENWQTLTLETPTNTDFSVDRNFYINTKKVD